MFRGVSSTPIAVLTIVSGVVLSGAGAPVDGVTGAGSTVPGGLYLDTTNAVLYFNRNTKANPLWTLLVS